MDKKANLSRWMGRFLIFCQLMEMSCNSYKPVVMKTRDPREISSLVVTGKYYELTLKNETKKILVKGIDSLKLWGIVREPVANGTLIHYKDTVRLQDIAAIKERRFDPVNVLMILCFISVLWTVLSLFKFTY